MLGLTSRETADLAKKSHDVSRDVLGKPGITKRFFVESHDVPTNVMGLKGLNARKSRPISPIIFCISYYFLYNICEYAKTRHAQIIQDILQTFFLY